MRSDTFRAALAAALIPALVLAGGQQAHAQPAAATIEIVRAGLVASASLAEAGDGEGAAAAAAFASEQFALGLGELRELDAGLTDGIHLDLLDLAVSGGAAGPGGSAASVLDRLGGYGPGAADGAAIVHMLTVADEQYAGAHRTGEEAPYEVSRALFRAAGAAFADTADPGSALDAEQLSFFRDIDEAVGARADFVRVGNLVGAIQRDLLGTLTLSRDEAALYAEIRALYARLLEAVDAGDYAGAEGLAVEAYLENFEYLEPTLEAADAEFMYALEVDMREALRGMIRDRDPPASIRGLLESSILPDLEAAEQKSARYLAANPQGAGPAVGTAERGDTTGEEQSAVRGEIDAIRAGLREMLAHYGAGDRESAHAAARSAYLDSYEHVEVPLRPIAPDFTLEVEYQFAEVRSLIKAGAPYAEVSGVAAAIDRNLDESERLVTGTGQVAPLIAFTASFAIIFREGLEAVLILGAITTYLEASRNSRFKRYVHYGVLAAVGATAATWLAASYLIEISGASRELIEAVAALSATAVLFYVSFWILNKIEHRKWMEFVRAKVWQATTTGSVAVFVMLSFFTVYREGFETVLFYQAMLGFSAYFESHVGAGFAAGLASLFAVYFAVRRLGRRLPLRALFGLTLGIGAYLSIAFLGNAVREFQVLDVVPYTGLIGTVPRLDVNLASMTGIYPTLETVVAQAALLSVYAAASLYVLALRPRRAARIAAMRVSRGGRDAA